MAEPLRDPVAGNMEERRIQASAIRRSPEQEQSRIQRARGDQFQASAVRPLRPVAANDNEYSAANDNKTSLPPNVTTRDQERVGRNRFFKAQVVLSAQEEAHSQIKREEDEKPNLLRYTPAFTVAIFKDGLLDFILIGSIPVVGTVVTFFCSVLIFIFLIFAKKNSSMQDMRFIIRRLLIILVSFIVEGFIFGVNFFPFEVVTVYIIYFMDKHLSEKQIAILRNITHTLNRKSL